MCELISEYLIYVVCRYRNQISVYVVIHSLAQTDSLHNVVDYVSVGAGASCDGNTHAVELAVLHGCLLLVGTVSSEYSYILGNLASVEALECLVGTGSSATADAAYHFNVGMCLQDGLHGIQSLCGVDGRLVGNYLCVRSQLLN